MDTNQPFWFCTERDARYTTTRMQRADKGRTFKDHPFQILRTDHKHQTCEQQQVDRKRESTAYLSGREQGKSGTKKKNWSVSQSGQSAAA